MATEKDNKKKPSTGVLGASGTDIFSGIITEEYNPKLSDIKGIKIFDEMRKSDGTVRAAMTAVQLPIRRANWYIKTKGETDKDMEVRRFVERALFEEMTIAWDDFLRQALLMLPFGVMVFEKVYTTAEFDGKTYIVWKKMAPRMPKTITKWETEDGGQGIQQMTASGHSASIPMEKLLVFVNEIEGENWWGTSLLRAAYKHWFIKTNLERIDSIAHERQGLGIPSVEMPENYTPADVARAKTVLKNLRAHEQGYLIEESDIKVEFKDMKANTTRDPHRSIMYHNRQITLAVLAQFLDLGSNGGGSRALSEDHTDLFLQSLEAIANGLVDVINKHAIKELVDYNFDNVEVYPELDYAGISRVNVERLSTAYQRLTQSGGIKASDKDDQFLRSILGLPERSEEEIEEDSKKEDEKKNMKKQVEDMEMSELGSKKKISREEVKEALDNKLGKMGLSEQIDFVDKKIDELRELTGKKDIFTFAFQELHRHKEQLVVKKFKEENDFDGWRKLTFAEKKVNFESINSKMDELEKSLTDEGRKLLTDAKDEYMREMTKALNKSDVDKIKKLELKFEATYSRLLNKSMKEAYDYAKTNAAREMGVKTPATDADVARSISIASDTIASRQAEEIVYEAKTVLADRLAKKEPVPQIIGAMDAAIAKTIDQVTRNTAQVVIAGHINLGRRTVFEQNAEDIYALQRSEILDRKTCNFCLSIDGRIIEMVDPLGKIGTFHSNCRGIWVEILEDEEEKPSITGVPNSLRDRVGDATNELLQPKSPIVKKDSAASKKIENGKAGK